MKKIAAFTVAAIAGLFLYSQISISMGEKLPQEKNLLRRLPSIDFTLKDLNGTQVSLSDFRGKVVVLNFFATWCPPCRREMPSMQKLNEKLKGQKFEMLAVSVSDSTVDGLKEFMKNEGLSFRVLADGNSAGEKYGISSIPATFILDKDGNIVRKIVGAQDWADNNIIEALKLLMKE